MGEVVRITQAVDVRISLKPSDQLRNELVNFLNPNLDPKTVESLRAAFLFKSFYRRALERQNYYQRERDRVVHEAALRFAELPRTPILLNGVIKVGYNSGLGRIAVQARRRQQSDAIIDSYNILNDIPSIDEQSDVTHDNEEYKKFFVEFREKDMASKGEVDAARFELHKKTIHPATAASYYLVPDELVIRDTIVRQHPDVR